VKSGSHCLFWLGLQVVVAMGIGLVMLGEASLATEAGLPPDLDTNHQYCRRVRDAKTDGAQYGYLNSGLVARSTPNGEIQLAKGAPDGPGKAAVVRITASPPEQQDVGDRRWIRVKYISRLGTPRIGWISNGVAGQNINIANCLTNQD
jgi:hypothetical protein